jgi:hypothetical protein
MRKLFPFLMIFGLIVFTACDSDSNGDDSMSDTEMFVGTWAVSGLTDASGDRSAGLVESYNSVLITLGADASVTMAVDAKVPEASLTATGTHVVDETGMTMTATLEVLGQPTPLTFAYMFHDDDMLHLTPVPSTTILLGVLFQTQYTDPVEFTFTRVG